MRSILYLLAISAPLSAADVDFARDVRPILSQHCFQCHGPDAAARKGGARFDVRSDAIAKGKSGATGIVPGKPDESELIRRIDSHDRDELMPPPATKKPLSDRQKSILRQWVKEGAAYSEHWAFVSPKETPLPKTQLPDWGRGPIDQFVLAKMEANGLKPSPEANRFTLVRRAYLDLIGLPPTPAEAEKFINDPSPKAYEAMIDRLLDSPQYGERWARKWLDLARYADTNGYEKDRARSIWPYRDWVIRALNADMPFDQFTIRQLAGDMLPGATLDDRIATGLHRNTMLNEEGGADPLEFRWHAINDRTATTGTIWLGLTLNCCQCHNHKYDPISHREYFGLFAMLNNADEPTIEVPTPEITAKRQQIEKQVAERLAQLEKKFPAGKLEARFAEWRQAERSRRTDWKVVRPLRATANVPSLEVSASGVVRALGDTSKRDVYELTLATEGKEVNAIRIEALPDESLPGGGPGRTYYEGPLGEFFLSEVTLLADGKPVAIGSAVTSFAEGKNGGPGVIDGNPLTGWAINGGQGRAHELVLQLKQPVKSGELNLSLVFEKYYAAGLGKLRISLASTTSPVAASTIPHDVAVLIAKDHLSADEKKQLQQYFLETSPELKAEMDAIRALRNSMPKYVTTLALSERPAAHPRSTKLHTRGEYTRPADLVPAGIPSVLPPLPAGTEANRLGLAKWLVSGQHPLTARVTVNRAWAAIFGRGIVRTTEDFGLQGEPPSHPELLDWLAIEFVRNGWSMKKLHRLIVTSATYRQSSQVTPDAQAKDPKNVWLSRSPRNRLDAEVVRDNALRASGLLSLKLGGPSVFPPQPAGVSSEGAYRPLAWNVSSGEDRYRRGLYTYAKRTAPFAAFTTFDAPSGEACVARREVSNTPLQALTLLNDEGYMEAAQALGKLVAALQGDDESKVRQLWMRCLVRPPTADETRMVLEFYRAQAKRSNDLAWAATARVVLNLDEMVTRE